MKSKNGQIRYIRDRDCPNWHLRYPYSPVPEGTGGEKAAQEGREGSKRGRPRVPSRVSQAVRKEFGDPKKAYAKKCVKGVGKRGKAPFQGAEVQQERQGRTERQLCPPVRGRAADQERQAEVLPQEEDEEDLSGDESFVSCHSGGRRR